MLLGWEYDDPDLAAEHFLTVASYNLQHPAQFVDETITGLRAAFVEHLDNRLPVSEIRRRFARQYQGGARVLKDAQSRHPVLRTWCMTIADVYLPDHPAGAADRVRDWAAAIRQELP